MKRAIWGALVAAALFVGASAAQASTVDYVLTGKVTGVGSALSSAFNLGETLQAVLQFESSSGSAGGFPVLNYFGTFGNGVTITSRDPFHLDTTIYTVGTDTHVNYRMYGNGSGVYADPYSYTPMYVYLQLTYPTLAAPLTLAELLSVTTARDFIVTYDYSTPSVFGSFDLAAAPVATTPIPAALPLFASALGGLGFFGWRRRKNAAAAA
jgi:hypothetical protein